MDNVPVIKQTATTQIQTVLFPSTVVSSLHERNEAEVNLNKNWIFLVYRSRDRINKLPFDYWKTSPVRGWDYKICSRIAKEAA